MDPRVGTAPERATTTGAPSRTSPGGRPPRTPHCGRHTPSPHITASPHIIEEELPRETEVCALVPVEEFVTGEVLD